MNKKEFFRRASFSAIIVALTGLSAFAGLTNGDFSDGLNGWIASGGVSDGNSDGIPSTPDTGYAFFFPEDENVLSTSTLSQGFTIPEFAKWLSFDVNMVWTGEGGNETDVFTAYLNGVPFYSINNTDFTSPIIETFTYDVSGLIGQNVTLVFKLESDPHDALTSVSLDNVGISIPAPGAVVLGLIGTGAVGLWRRFSRRV